VTTHLPKEEIAMTDLELRLGYLIHDVSRLRRTLFDKWLSPLGITRSQWWVLAFLSRNDGMPQTELALELDVGKVALGALIDRLEESGFVKRVPDKSDRRVKRVVLTKQSKEVVETLREKSSEFNQSILSDIDREHLEVTAETLRLMKHNLLEGAKQFSRTEQDDDSTKSGARDAGNTASKAVTTSKPVRKKAESVARRPRARAAG
jgi:MarR family transcriptional regulator for hemolysin